MANVMQLTPVLVCPNKPPLVPKPKLELDVVVVDPNIEPVPTGFEKSPPLWLVCPKSDEDVVVACPNPNQKDRRKGNFKPFVQLYARYD